MITLSGSGPGVCIRCLGKVLRSQRPAYPDEANNGHYEVAVTLERYQFVRPEELAALAVTA